VACFDGKSHKNISTTKDANTYLMNSLAVLSVTTGIISLVSLLALHVISPEFKPSWRMVSEYALGKHKGFLTLFFYMWGASSLFLALGLIPLVTGFWPYLAILLLALTGIGAISGGLFDLKHKNHGLAFALGVPPLPVAALILTYHLLNTNIITQAFALVIAHATWVSVILMAISMMLMFSGFKKAGVAWDKDSPPPTEVPKGVIALAGYANRLLVFCYIFWIIYMAYLIN
jgi:hypothetical protein